MANELDRLKHDIGNAPLGAIGGAIVGYLVCKKLKYDKTISVISFTMVGLIIGAALGASIKSK